ncbi:hypothetical protein AQ490_09035 [Wenjunlia vitaminophila]|uniref:Glycosyltransferase n=1 Tax=Wenjunlia vitaminophila TaxID=76728 RepID=A0A0T6LLZ4_WENVI|nr:hypothetical protein [Wenjunlia vitaminophila]KRV46911.1 hypothetical protein AQ490_09035 [Wenjunlia vitaminophila]
MTGTLALVESPVQLLNVLEWAHRRRDGGAGGATVPTTPTTGPTGPRTPGPEGATAARRPEDPPDAEGRGEGTLRIAVLPPSDAVGRGQLIAMAGLARAEGHPVRGYPARGSASALARCLLALAPAVATARHLVLGDPFSGLAQTLLPLARGAREITVVDDGTATMEFVSLLGAGRPLVRWHHTGDARSSAARATRLLSPRRGRRIELFSSMPVTAPPDVLHTVNAYDWARSRYGPPRITPGVDMVGSSLVETGVVDRDRYLDGVATLVRTLGVTRYLAHRREDDDKLAVLAGRTGVRVVRPELPLELEARRGPTAARIVSFPSTVVHTLPVALAGTGAAVEVLDVDPAWLTSTASDRARSFLATVVGTARGPRRLDAVRAPTRLPAT